LNLERSASLDYRYVVTSAHAVAGARAAHQDEEDPAQRRLNLGARRKWANKPPLPLDSGSV
jgi:hypothetical protein